MFSSLRNVRPPKQRGWEFNIKKNSLYFYIILFFFIISRLCQVFIKFRKQINRELIVREMLQLICSWLTEERSAVV